VARTADAFTGESGPGADSFLTAVLACVAQPVWVVDGAGLLQYANPAAVAALGYESSSDLRGKSGHETLHYKRPDGSGFPAGECPILLSREAGQTIHDTDWFVRQDGSMFPVEYWSAPVDWPGGGAVVAFADITERRQVEYALRERDAVLSAVDQPVFTTTTEGVITYVNPAAVRTLGFGDASELVGQDGHWLVHYKRPDGSLFPLDECPLTQCREKGESLSVADDWLVCKDGSMVPVMYTAVPVQTRHGNAVVVAFTDMTLRLAGEQAARERDIAQARAAELSASKARHREVLEAALDGVITMGRDARLAYVNSAAERIFGFQAAEVIGRELAEVIVPPSLRALHREGLRRYLATGESSILDRRIETTALRADGSEFPAELTVTRTGAPGSPTFTGYVRDVTERKRAEQELIASRARLVTASDAARQRVTRDLHDGAQQWFISAIMNLQLAQQNWASAPGQARELLDAALTEAKRGVDDLREIAAGIHPALLTQRGLAVALDGLVARLPVLVQLDVPDRRLPGPIEASVYFFCSEALTNVVKHARATCAWVRVRQEDGQCTIEVRDDGIGGAGAQPETSGLTGLHDRISALRGALDISSPAGGGTVLRARIPLARDLAFCHEPAGTDSRGRRRGSADRPGRDRPHPAGGRVRRGRRRGRCRGRGPSGCGPPPGGRGR
jgi:PAS domain S-box-containing protein